MRSPLLIFPELFAKASLAKGRWHAKRDGGIPFPSPDNPEQHQIPNPTTVCDVQEVRWTSEHPFSKGGFGENSSVFLNIKYLIFFSRLLTISRLFLIRKFRSAADFLCVLFRFSRCSTERLSQTVFYQSRDFLVSAKTAPA